MKKYELTAGFGGTRLLAPHRPDDAILIPLTENNVSRDLVRNPSQSDLTYSFIARVHAKATRKLTATPAIKELDRRLQATLLNPKDSNQILHTICLDATGRCDLPCLFCYKNHKAHQGQWLIYESAIREAHTHGAQTVYIAGEGEPFLDDHIGKIIRLATELDMQILLFHNGLQFCSESIVYRKRRAMIMKSKSNEASAQDFTKWLTGFPGLYMYLKMHSAKRELNDHLCGIKEGQPTRYSYKTVGYKNKLLDIPNPLLQLPDWGFDTERLGFDWMVTKQNADEALELVGPWSQSYGLAFYCEPLMLSGKMPKNAGEYRPTSTQLAKLQQAGYLVRLDCTFKELLASILVSGRGYVLPIIGFTWDQYIDRPSLVYNPEEGFINQRDNHSLFQILRYQGGCPCGLGLQSLNKLLDKHAPSQKTVT